MIKRIIPLLLTAFLLSGYLPLKADYHWWVREQLGKQAYISFPQSPDSSQHGGCQKRAVNQDGTFYVVMWCPLDAADTSSRFIDSAYTMLRSDLSPMHGVKIIYEKPVLWNGLKARELKTRVLLYDSSYAIGIEKAVIVNGIMYTCTFQTNEKQAPALFRAIGKDFFDSFSLNNKLEVRPQLSPSARFGMTQDTIVQQRNRDTDDTRATVHHSFEMLLVYITGIVLVVLFGLLLKFLFRKESQSNT